MASLIVDQGLQFMVGRLSSTADSFAALQSMSVDDSSNAFTSTDTALNSGGAVSNQADADFDSTPTRSAQTTTHIATFASGVANFNHRRIALHNAAASSVSSSTSTLFGGTDGQNFTKTSSYEVVYTVTVAATDNS